MTTETLDASLLSVGALFDDVDAKYTIPIYQRNYAWRAEQIEQLISDVYDAMREGSGTYFLGNLIVTKRNSKTTDYEVIDGQQRLTTLYLLLTVLQGSGLEIPGDYKERLRYQSRPRSTEALRRISSNLPKRIGPSADALQDEDAGIHQGFNVIGQFMEQRIPGDERSRFAEYLRGQVTLVRAILPKRTDLNRYFEIMNTRGQQLQQVDIVKARLMALLDSAAEQACFAWAWESCADMDSYVQMTLTHGNTELRESLFGEDWGWLRANSFADLLSAHGRLVADAKETSSVEFSDAALTLDDALLKYATAGAPSLSEDPDNVRFRSTIEFPAFLLHVLKIWQGDDSVDEGGLDDKKLIERYATAFDRKATSEAALRMKVREFLALLVRCRNHFDAFVLKRQFTAANIDEGDWSLQRLVKGKIPPGRKTASPRYINTATSVAVEAEDDGDVDPATNDLLLIESMLRVTYTSPRTMHWITLILRTVNTAPFDQSVALLRDALRRYTREQVRRQLSETGQPALGFGISRLVFTYVDYLLATKSPNRDFRFTFRNSIEHFYPQGEDPELERAYGELDNSSDRDLFGNLALVTVSDNSKFSNLPPFMKAQSQIVAQSPKLGKMADVAGTDKRAWNSAAIKAHHDAMVDMLRGDLGIS
jgi:hypothetical protein